MRAVTSFRCLIELFGCFDRRIESPDFIGPSNVVITDLYGIRVYIYRYVTASRSRRDAKRTGFRDAGTREYGAFEKHIKHRELPVQNVRGCS